MTLNPTLGFLLHDVARLPRKRFEQHAKHVGLTRSQWQALAYLSRCEGIHQSALADMLDIEPITLMRILDKLCARGFVTRQRHETDRRIQLLFMTDQARALLAEMRGLGDTTRSEALAGVSQDDRDRLFDILDLMKTNLQQACRAPAETETDNG